MPDSPRHSSSQSGLTAFNVAPIGPSGGLGPAQEDQRTPALAGGPGVSLAVWNDARNFRFRAGDLYGARVRDGGVLDPLGVPLVSGPANDEEPSLAWDGTAWVLVWTRNDYSVYAERLAPDLSSSVPLFIAQDVHRARVAFGGGHTLVVYRRNIGFPVGALLASDGGLRVFGGGLTELNFATPSNYYRAGLAAAWSESAQAFYVLAPDRTGLLLIKVDPGPTNPVPEPPVVLSTMSFPTDFNAGADLAFAPDGTMAIAWRAQQNLWATVLPSAPTGAIDAGPQLSVAANGSPSLSWAGSRFRLALSTTTTSELRDLTETGTTLVSAWAPFPSDINACASCAPAVVDGTSVVRNFAGGGARGADLSVEVIALDAGAGTASTLTSSGLSSQSPSAAFDETGLLALLTWSSPDDGGVLRHDVSVRLLNLANGNLGGVIGLSRDSSRDDALPRAHWWNDQWWVGTLANFTLPSPNSQADVYSSPAPANGTLTFSRSFSSLYANTSPVFVNDFVAINDTTSVFFDRLNATGGVDAGMPGGVGATTAWHSGIAADSLGRPLAIAIARPSTGTQNVWLFTPGGGAANPLTMNAGEPRFAEVASDGTHFTAVYTTVPGAEIALQRQDLEVENDGGVTLRGGPVEITRAAFLETPSIVFTQGQYLVTWTERARVDLPGRVHLRTLKPDGGVGVEVPLDLGVAGTDLGARIALAPDGGASLITWTRLDSPDAGAPVAWMGRIAIGRGQGATCALDAECTTGHCVDQVCCGSACNEGCGTCSAAGECGPRGFQTCRPQGECQTRDESCDGVALTCSLANAVPDGMACDGGDCRSGLCVPFPALDAGAPDAGPVDGGLDAGATDAGSPDAGGPDAGEADAGDPDAGEAEVDAGNQGAPVAPRDFSHYSWSQGCGCSGSEGLPMFAVLGLLLLGRRRGAGGRASGSNEIANQRHRSPRAESRGVLRSANSDSSRRPSTPLGQNGDSVPISANPLALTGSGWRTSALLALVLISSTALAQAPQRKLKLSFPGIAAGTGARAEDATAISEFLQSQLVARGIYEVTGASDLAAMLGLERQKQLLGCGGDTACAVDIAGALDANRLLTGSLSKVGDSWLLTFSLFDVRTSATLYRASHRFTGGLDRALDAIDPMLGEMISRDDAARAAAGEKAEPPAANQWSIGVRAEAEALGLLDGQPAIAPAVTATWGRGLLGAALTVIILPTPGVRAEGRLHLLEASRVRPLITLGVVLFGLAFAPRASLGVTFDAGPVRLGVDAGVEYFVSGPSHFSPLALLFGLGAAWRL